MSDGVSESVVFTFQTLMTERTARVCAWLHRAVRLRGMAHLHSGSSFLQCDLGEVMSCSYYEIRQLFHAGGSKASSRGWSL